MKKAVIIKIVVSLTVVLLGVGVFIVKKAQAAPATSVTVPSVQENPTGTFQVAPPNPPKDTGDLLITAPFDFATFRASGLPVLIDFGADSCVPCKEMAPVLEELNRTLKGKAIIRFVDVWKYRDLANGVPLQVIPTQVLFDAQGKPFTPSEKLQMDFNLYSMKDSGEHAFTTHEGGLTKDQILAILKEMGMK